MSQRLKIMLLLLALPVTLCSGIGLWFGARAAEQWARQREHIAARAQWDARAFGDYRLVAEDGDCTYDVVVRNGQIRGNYRDSCNLRARTVEGLFTLIDGDGSALVQCGTQGCICEAMTLASAEYDAMLGYPRMLVIEANLQPYWLHPDLWRYLAREGDLPACAGGSRRVINVLYVGAAE